LLNINADDDDWNLASSSWNTKEFYNTKDNPKVWLNYENFKAIVEAWNTTEKEIADIIKQDWYTLSQRAKEAVRHYINTGEIDKNLFFKK
jgi:cytochrome c556